MTRLRTPVRRVVSGVIRRDLVVTLYPGGVIGMRELRHKKEFHFPIGSCYTLAIVAERQAAAREKKKLKLKGAK